MSITKPATTTRAIAIRLDPTLRAQLNAVATQADRQLSQLIRYSIADYLALSPLLLPLKFHSPEPEQGNPSMPDLETRVLTFRLSEALSEALEEHAKVNDVTISDVVRQALILWLSNVDLQKLGIAGGNYGSN